MSHEQVTYSSTATMLHELNIQLTSLIAHECVNLIDSFIKTLTLDICNVAARKDHNPYSMYGSKWIRQIVFHVWKQGILFDDFKNSPEISNYAQQNEVLSRVQGILSYDSMCVQFWHTCRYHSIAFKIKAQQSQLWRFTFITDQSTVKSPMKICVQLRLKHIEVNFDESYSFKLGAQQSHL